MFVEILLVQKTYTYTHKYTKYLCLVFDKVFKTPSHHRKLNTTQLSFVLAYLSRFFVDRYAA